MTKQIQPYEPAQIVPAVQTFSGQLTDYLRFLGLPDEDVLVPIEQRRSVTNNMETVVSVLTSDQRAAAMYISKFVTACAVGLFDAALNFLWNETIRNLRAKVVRFDLVYFYDSVIPDSNKRSKFNTEADLEKLDDWELSRGCLLTGILSDNGFRHLDYIRNMRNYASAAHPNHIELTGLQVVSWLETCILEVLAKEPAGPVIEVKKLLFNLRNEVLTSDDVAPIAANLPSLPDDLAGSLLRAILGMYTDTRIAVQVRDNIKLIASSVWQVAPDDSRYDAGLKLANLEANGEASRVRLAKEFLDLVDGLAYLPPDRLALEIATALESLMSIHNGWDNFYNEPAPAVLLSRLIPSNGQVPVNVLTKYVKTLIMCRIGNGYGVSAAAVPTYETLIGQFSDREATKFVGLPRELEFAARLQFSNCATNFQRIAAAIEPRVINRRLKSALLYIIGFQTSNLNRIGSDRSFRALLAALVPTR